MLQTNCARHSKVTCACIQRRTDTTNFRKRPCFLLREEGWGFESSQSVFVNDVTHQSENTDETYGGRVHELTS